MSKQKPEDKKKQNGDQLANVRERLRSQFPTLKNSGWIFFENAGGSQVPKQVADAVHHYYLNNFVQLGAGYEISDKCTDLVADAHKFIGQFMNAVEGKVVFGASTSALVNNLANAYAAVLKEGDEIIVSQDGHEANCGPWVRLTERLPGVKLVIWPIEAKTYEMKLSKLESLLSPKTRIVAVTHVSNMLGEVLPLKEVCTLVHKKSQNARVVADGVAFAAHRVVDVQDWGVDYYAYSTYKVYGPHMACLYMKDQVHKEVTGPNHFFIPKEDVPYKWELGCISHEGCAGILALKQYVNAILDRDAERSVDRKDIVQAWNILTELEKPLVHKLIAYLSKKPHVKVIGPSDPDSPSRVPTICFVHDSIKSESVCKRIHSAKIGARHGHFYSARLDDALGLSATEGVVRVSLVHYNTPDEVNSLLKVLDEIFDGKKQSKL